MFLKTPVRVTSVGEDVLLALGNNEWRLNFEAALVLSALMRLRAKQAKALAEDFGMIWNLSGTLHDASKGLNHGQPFNPHRVYPVGREMLKKENILAGVEGANVVLNLKGAEAKIPYRAALKIAQWVRLRAKESKTRAGDVSRHWSQVA